MGFFFFFVIFSECLIEQRKEVVNMIKATRSAIAIVRHSLEEDKVFESFKVTIHDTENKKMRTMTMWLGEGWDSNTDPIYNGYVTHVDGKKIDIATGCGMIRKHATNREIAAFLILSWGIATR